MSGIMPERFNSTSQPKITVSPVTWNVVPLQQSVADDLMPDVRLQCPTCNYPYSEFQHDRYGGECIARCINGHMWIAS